MHTIDLAEQAIYWAEKLGYKIRYEWLGGSQGGLCEFAGKKFIFVDISLSQIEQFEQLREALMQIPEAKVSNLSPSLRKFLGLGQIPLSA